MWNLVPFERRARDIGSYFDDLEKSIFNNFEGAVMRTDIIDKGEAFELRCSLPGVKKEDISIKLQDGSLVISATVNETTENYLRRETRTGTFTRRFSMEGVETSAITAAHENGVLILTLPKVKEKQPEETVINIQ